MRRHSPMLLHTAKTPLNTVNQKGDFSTLLFYSILGYPGVISLATSEDDFIPDIP